MLRYTIITVVVRDGESLKKLAVHENVDDAASAKERIVLQLNVLYNLVTQMDNAFNTQLAATAGRDSTSMKILAFISAIVLPGSFVAGVFSMNMLDSQYTPGGNGSSNSRDAGVLERAQ